MDRWNGWTLFTIRGIPVNAHLSLLFLLLYVVLVGTIQFPFVVEASGVNPYLVGGSALLWSVAFALSLVASVLLHEFSHVAVARAKGAKVRRVTLMMLGGVSEMEKVPEDPASEFKISIVGPLVSLAIAGALFFVHQTVESPGWAFYAYWVGRLNLVLGVFNLLPAFPTDGGRVLRAFLVSRHGALEGTRRAVTVSRFFVWAFGILGVLQLNFILVLVAMFLYAAAKSELFVVTGQAALRDMRVGDLVSDLPPLSEEATLGEAARALETAKSAVLPVDGRRPGVVDAVTLSRIPRVRWDELRVKDLKVEVADPPRPEDPLAGLLKSALFAVPGGVPVVEDGRIVGVIRHRDVIEAIQLKDLARGGPRNWDPPREPAA